MSFLKKISTIKVKIYKFYWSFLYKKKVKVEKIEFGHSFILDIQSGKDFSIEMKNVTFRDFCSIHLRKEGRIFIGEGVFFNSFCSLNCLDSITIGSNTIFGENVKIYDQNHKYNNSKELIKNQGYVTTPVLIGENCWIGSNVIILKGVNIGDNSVIGCGLTIYKDVPPNSLLINKQDIVYKSIINE